MHITTFNLLWTALHNHCRTFNWNRLISTHFAITFEELPLLNNNFYHSQEHKAQRPLYCANILIHYTEYRPVELFLFPELHRG